MVPTSYWARAGLCPGANKLEGGFHSGPSQHQRPCGRRSELPRMAAASACVPRMSCSSFLPLQDQQASLTQAHVKLLPLPWVLECVRFCVCPLSMKSISLNPLAPPKVSPCGLPSQMLWGLVFPVQDPWAGEPDMGLKPLSPLR